MMPLFSNFGEVSMDYLIGRIMMDVEEFITNDGETKIDEDTKELLVDWMEWVSEDKLGIISETEKKFIQRTIEDSIGGMPIWKKDKDFQESVLSKFKLYFENKSSFYLMFRDAYIKGLEEEGLNK